MKSRIFNIINTIYDFTKAVDRLMKIISSETFEKITEFIQNLPIN